MHNAVFPTAVWYAALSMGRRTYFARQVGLIPRNPLFGQTLAANNGRLRSEAFSAVVGRQKWAARAGRESDPLGSRERRRYHVRPARSIFSKVLNFCPLRTRPWSARRDGITARQEGRRYRLRRRRASDSVPFCRWRPVGLSTLGPRSALARSLKLPCGQKSKASSTDSAPRQARAKSAAADFAIKLVGRRQTNG
jgi:hypothetical protein